MSHKILAWFDLGLALTECKHEADVVIAMDGSGSIEKPNFYKMLDFVKEMIEAMDVDTGTRISLMTFSTDAAIRFVCLFVCLSVRLSHTGTGIPTMYIVHTHRKHK